MKRITFLLLMLFATAQHSFAQVEFSGSQQYGRLSNFVYDATTPNKLYAATLSKHIMVSTNNGVSWNVLYTLPYASYDPIVQNMKLTNNGTALSFEAYYAPGSSLNNISVLNLATASVIKQYDMPVAAQGSNFSKYVIFDDGTLNTVMILASNSQDKVLYTIDGGDNWNTVFDSANYESVILNDIVIDPNNASKFYIARNGGAGNVDGGLLISSDAGQTWTLTLDGLILQTVAVNPANSNDIYVGTGVRWSYPSQLEAVYRSLDGGLTWNVIPLVWNQYATLGGYCAIFSITFNPNDPSQIVILEDNQIISSVDNGVTWQNTIFEGYPSPASFNYYMGNSVAINPMNKYEMFIDNTWYPLHSTDGAVTTSILPNPFFNATRDMNLVDLPGEQHLYYGVQWGYVNRNLLTSTETAIDVTGVDEVFMGEPGYKMVADKNILGRMYTFQSGWMGNTISVSNDHGVTKNPIYNTYEQILTRAVTAPNNQNVGWFATFDGVNCYLRKIDFTDVFNASISDIALPVNNDYLNGILIDNVNSNKIIITIGNEVYKTIDGGTSWSLITSGLDDLQLPNIAIDISQNPFNVNQITMAASNGIYTSLDGGENWSKIYNSFVSKVEHSTKTNGHILATVHSLYDITPKIIYSSDSGVTWTEINSTMLYDAIITSSAFKFNNTSADVYLGSTDLGVLKISIDFESLSISDSDEEQNSVLIYPNPTKGIFNIRSNDQVTVHLVEVFNNLGQKVLEFNKQQTCDISGLSDGIYYIRITDSNNNLKIKKMMKQ